MWEPPCLWKIKLRTLWNPPTHLGDIFTVVESPVYGWPGRRRQKSCQNEFLPAIKKQVQPNNIPNATSYLSRARFKHQKWRKKGMLVPEIKEGFGLFRSSHDMYMIYVWYWTSVSRFATSCSPSLEPLGFVLILLFVAILSFGPGMKNVRKSCCLYFWLTM